MQRGSESTCALGVIARVGAARQVLDPDDWNDIEVVVNAPLRVDDLRVGSPNRPGLEPKLTMGVPATGKPILLRRIINIVASAKQVSSGNLVLFRYGLQLVGCGRAPDRGKKGRLT